MSHAENNVCGALVIYRQLFMLCGESEVRTVWSPNQGPYWSVSVFVSVPVCEAAKHVVHTLTRANIQTQHGVQMY